MSKSEVISLQNLALRLCGKPADSVIANEKVDSILNYLESAVFGKNLRTWYADKPFPPYESELDGIFGFKKYGEKFNWEPYKEIKNGELEWEQFIEKYACEILVRQDDFKNYLKNALLKNSVVVNSTMEEWNEEKKKPTGHIEFAKQGYNNAIEEGKFLTRLKDLYEKNQPWRENAGAASGGSAAETGKQDAIPLKGFYVRGDDYSTAWMNGKQYQLNTERRREIIKALHQKDDWMIIGDIQEAVSYKQNEHIIKASFKGKDAEKIKKALLENNRKGYWRIKK